MNALVTGGAGFIGSNLVRLLLDRGHQVTVLDNLSSGHQVNSKGLPIRFVEGDVRDPAAVAKAIDGSDAVFHLAASVGNTRSINHPVEDSEINVIGTLRILEAARAAKVRKVVFSSSAGIFGELKTMPIYEDHPVEPDSPYGASKLCAEKLCLAYSKLHGLETMCLRYFNVYGVNQRYDAYGNVIPIFAHRLFAGEPLVIFGDGEQTRDLVNVRDVAEANYRASQISGAWGAFNVASGTRVTINHLASLMREVTGIPAKIEHGPPRPGDVRHSLASVQKARDTFGYDPKVPLREGLVEYLSWAKQAGV